MLDHLADSLDKPEDRDAGARVAPAEAALASEAVPKSEFPDMPYTVLTAKGKKLHINGDQVAICAALSYDNGEVILVLLRTRKGDNLVRQTRMEAALLGVQFTKEVVVDNPQQIANFYYGSIRAEVTQSSIDTERYFVDRINQALEVGATDLHWDWFTDQPMASIRLRVNSELTEPIDWLHNDKCLQLFNSAWELCDNRRQQWQQYADQSARLVNNDELRELGLHPNIISCRMQWASADDGTALAMRIFTREAIGGGKFTLDTLGFMDDQLVQLQAIRDLPHGMFIVIGPTGSGKSTTLKYTFERIDDETHGTERNYSLEDPVEFPIRGMRQFGITYAAGTAEREAALQAKLVTLMRMDPDRILVHEIREAATARLAIQACQTGHWMASTTHATSVFGGFKRLGGESIGVPPGDLYHTDSIVGMLAQRLVPKVCDCDECWRDLSKAAKDPAYGAVVRRVEVAAKENGHSLENIRFRGLGCPKCRRILRQLEGQAAPERKTISTGVKGAVMIAEVLMPDAEFLGLLRDGAEKGEERPAREYLNSLRKRGADDYGVPPPQTMMKHAWEKVLAGLIDPLDAERAVGRFTPLGVTGAW